MMYKYPYICRHRIDMCALFLPLFKQMYMYVTYSDAYIYQRIWKFCG